MKRQLPRIAILTTFAGIFFIARTNQSGPGGGYTNAPSESNCATSGCHSSGGLVTSGTNWNRIQLKNNFTGGGYIPDSTYTLVLTHKETGMSNSGFQITCLDGKNKPAGTFTTLDSRTQSFTAVIGSDTRRYLGHTSTGTSTHSTDTSSYRIQWKAPNSNLGDLTFYVTWNKGNGQGNNTGDVIYAKTFIASPSTLLPSCDVKIQETNLCQSALLTFDATTSGSPTSYKWQFIGSGASITSSNLQNPKVSFSSTTTTYRAVLTVSNSKGSSLPDTLSFTVKPSPSATISPSVTQEFCQGDSVQLSGNQITNATYLWSPTGQTTRTIFAKDSANYTVTVTAVNGCSRTSNSLLVKVNSLPEVMAIKSFTGDTICSDEVFSIAGIVTKGSADSFSFSSKSGPFTKATSMDYSQNSGAVTYSVWGKNAKGCVSKPSSVTIQTKTRPNGPVLSSSNIDFTGFRVNWDSVANATGYKVSVDSGKTYINPSSGATGKYHDVTGLLGNHKMRVLVYALIPGLCDNTESSSIVVTTRSCDPIDFSVTTGDNRVCLGSQAEITVHHLKGMNVGIMLDGQFAGKDTIQKLTVTGTRFYTVSVIDSTATLCGYTNDSILLVEDTAFTPVVKSGAQMAFCSNNSTVPFTLEVGQINAYDSFNYYLNSNLVARKKAFSHQYTVSNGDQVWVSSTNAGGCESKPSSSTQIAINPIPVAAFNSQNTQFDYTFTATDTTGTHSWRIGNDSTTGYKSDWDLTAKALQSVTVYHRITKNGCSSRDSLKFTVPDFAGNQKWKKSLASVYPNPAQNSFHVFVPNTGDAVLELYSATGYKILTQVLKQGENTINAVRLSPGAFVYRISHNNIETTGSLVIER